MRSQVNTRMRRLHSCGSPPVDARGRVRAFNSCEPVLHRCCGVGNCACRGDRSKDAGKDGGAAWASAGGNGREVVTGPRTGPSAGPAGVEVAALRDPAVLLHGLTGIDAVHTFYHDETNNVRRLRVTPAGFNVADPKPFVLGGVVHDGEPRAIDLGRLRAAMQLQPGLAEVKVANVARGGFLDTLGSPRLSAFLGWLGEERLDVHFLALDPFYWACVDIVDSVVEPGSLPVGPLKNDLFRILRVDPAGTATLFHRFSFPAVSEGDVGGFVRALLDLLKEREQLLDHFNMMMLKGVLQAARGLPSLGMLDNAPGELVSDFTLFFMHRISLFSRSRHVFDEELHVQRELAAKPLLDGGVLADRHRFARSHDEPGVQLSDVVVGVVGRCLSWLRTVDRAEVAAALAGLTPRQERNRVALSRLLDHSVSRCQAFVHTLLSLDDIAALWAFLDAPPRVAAADV